MTTMDLRVDSFFEDVNNPTKFSVNIGPAEEVLAHEFGYIYSFFPCYIGALDIPNSIFPAIQDAETYFLGLYASVIMGMVDGYRGTTSTLGNVYSHMGKTVRDAMDSKANTSSMPTTFDHLTDGATNKSYTSTEKTKLAGIATAATANDTDANLKNRANHTGAQAESTVTNLTTDLANRPTVYFGATLKSGAIFYAASAVVSGGAAVFYLTADGLSTGTAIFPNGPNMDSLNAFVSDASASYQMAAALTNSNKTLTITANKLTTANILTGILGQASANSATIRLTVWGS